MKKHIKRIFLTLIVIIAVAAVGLTVVFHSEIRTLMSLKQMDDHPFYTMTYYGDYGFDDFLKQGAHSDGDIENFITHRLLKGLPIKLNVTEGGCSAFTAVNDNGEHLYGRNFDFTYSPAVLVKTKPKNGYSSISMANLAFAGYTEKYIPKPKTLSSFLTLAAPYLPFDGMNEKGLCVALLAVSEAHPKENSKAVTLNTTTTIRLLLDKAANVEQAEKLLKEYNIYFSGGVNCHYLIEDATGKSVLAEYWDNNVQFVESKENYQVATNFIEYDGLNIGETGTSNYAKNEFERYDIINTSLAKSGGGISADNAMALLKSASQKKTQWSIVYNLKTLSGKVCIANDYSSPYSFDLKS